MNRLERSMPCTHLAWEAVGPIENDFWIVTNYGSRAFLLADWQAVSAYLLAQRLNAEAFRPTDAQLTIIARELNIEFVRLRDVLNDKSLTEEGAEGLRG